MREIEKLRISRDLDSKSSSKPPSTDLLKKSEKSKHSEASPSSEKKKRRWSDYLTNPAGMLHGQASTGHRCGYISFQVDHNGSHCVETPWTVFLHCTRRGVIQREKKMDASKLPLSSWIVSFTSFVICSVYSMFICFQHCCVSFPESCLSG